MVDSLETWYRDVMVKPYVWMIQNDTWKTKDDKDLIKKEVFQKFFVRFQFIIMQSVTNPDKNFPREPVQFLSKVISGELEPVLGYWLEFERKALFKQGKFCLEEQGYQRDKQVDLIIYSFILVKVIGARLLCAVQEPKVFPGIPTKELPYLRLAGLTCIALLTDIVTDIFKSELPLEK